MEKRVHYLMPHQIWPFKPPTKEQEYLRKEGFSGFGAIFSDENEARAEGKKKKDEGFQVKLLTTETKFGKRYTLWARKVNPIKYEDKLKDLIIRTRNSGIKVDFVGTKTLKDYMGMNTEAAHDMGYPLGNKTIHISKSASAKDKYDTLKHELYEMEQMKKGESYWKAHVKALARENPMAKIRKKRKLTVYNRFMRESMTYWISQGYSAKDAMRKAANEWGNKKLGEPEHNPIDGNTKKYLMYGAVIIGAILLWRRSQSNA